MEEIRNIIRKKYTMDRELTAWRWEVEQLEREVPRRVYELREAKNAQTEYEGFGLRSLADKLSGKYEEKKQAYAKAARDAQAALDTSRWQLDSAKSTLASLEQEAETLPTREELFEKYPDLEFLRCQDTLLCTERLTRLLRENEKHLKEARDWAENRNADFSPRGTYHYDKSVSLQKGADCARQISMLLDRICENGFTVDVHAYFRNPDGFIAGTARQYGQQDRINYAIRAVRTATEVIQELTLQLADA